MKVEHLIVEGEAVKRDTTPITIPRALPATDFQKRIYCLVSTIQGMKSLPGRKALVVVAEHLLPRDDQAMSELGVSTPFDSFIDTRAADSALRTIAEVANRASVVIYAIDPGGLVSDLPGAAPEGSTAAQRREAEESRQRARRSLKRLAEETGGIAVFNRHDLKNGLDQIVADQRSLYLIGFKPPKSAFAKASGKAGFHVLKLAVNRPDAVVRTRSGFLGATDREVEGRNR
jgi:VWFA-related protein